MSVGEGPRVEPSAPERGGLIATLGIAQSADFDLAADRAIPAGTTAALLGPNGAGKSTAVAAIAGLRALERGRIVLDGRVLDDPAAGLFVPAPDRRIGVVFQDQLLFDHMSVQDNVAFGLRARGLSRAAATEQSRDWIEHVGLQGLHDRRPRELSGGQAQRVALARALAPDPDLLLLDEPLSALDVTTRASLRRTLAQHLEGFAGPRLVITHEPTEAFLLADDVHVLEGGRITQVGTPDDIRLRPKTPYAADLAGANLLTGQVNDGMVEVTGGGALHVADHAATGAVLVAISPTAVTVHRQRPEGSQRNTWATTLERVEHLGDRVRLRTRSPVPLTIEVTREATDELGLVVDAEVWVAVKATEIGLQSEQPV